MNQHSLNQLIRRRHRIVLLLAFLMIVFFGIMQGTGTVSNFHMQDQEEISRTNYVKHVYPYLSKSEQRAGYKAYINRFKQVRYGSPKTNLMYQDGTFFNYFIFLLTILLGCVMTFWDQISGFNRLLFSSGMSRRRIYLTKLKWYLTVILPAWGINAVITMLFVWFGIPHHYLTIYWVSLLLFIPVYLIQLSAALAAGSLFGMVIGQTLPLVATIGFLGMSAGPAVSRAVQLLHAQKSWSAWLTQPLAAYGTWIALAILFLGLSLYFYPRVSLENSHQYLLFPQLRPVVLIGFTLYVPFVMQNWLFYDYPWLSMILTGGAVFVFLFWYLYHPTLGRRNKAQESETSPSPRQ